MKRPELSNVPISLSDFKNLKLPITYFIIQFSSN
jgi:hypothetical protein